MIEQQELLQVSFQKLMQTKTYTAAILSSEEKRFAIYIDPHIGKTLQMYFTNIPRIRPLTHDLFHHALQGLYVRVKQVVIMQLQDTIYFARLFLEQQIGTKTHLVEVDARPSDALAMALIEQAPIYCTKEVLEQSVELEEYSE